HNEEKFDEQNSDNEDQNQSNKFSLKTQINDYNNQTNSFLNNDVLIKELALKITQLEEKITQLEEKEPVSKLERKNSTLLESLMKMENDEATDNERDGNEEPGACERNGSAYAYSSFIISSAIIRKLNCAYL
ncbi:17380_t:CDS:2, partial [Gigaspora rosea]